MSSPKAVIAVTSLLLEARIAAGPGVSVICVPASQLVTGLRAAIERGALGIISFGLSSREQGRGVRRWSLPTCASISLEYSQHRAKRQDVAMAVERRRVQARGAASVKKQSVGAVQPVTE
jgi:hypothetical protein